MSCSLVWQFPLLLWFISLPIRPVSLVASTLDGEKRHFTTQEGNRRKKNKKGKLSNGPVFLAEVLEVVHVAAGGRVLSIFRLPHFGVGELQQVAVVLHHVLAFLETPRGKYCSALSFHMLHLQTKHTKVSVETSADDPIPRVFDINRLP